jgi:hypothetical protein
MKQKHFRSVIYSNANNIFAQFEKLSLNLGLNLEFIFSHHFQQEKHLSHSKLQ